MKERPILFSGPMVRALLNGGKRQTRRSVKAPVLSNVRDPDSVICSDGQASFSWRGKDVIGGFTVSSPYGKPGDLLWVRETWQSLSDHDHLAPRDIPVGSDVQYPATYDGWASKRRPSIHMPRWVSRILLEITAVRVERLQDISREDVSAEGVRQCDGSTTLFHSFGRLWESINGPGSWGQNPWVWVIEFRRIES